MRLLATVVVAALAVTSAGAAEIGPWPASSTFMWETQPLAGYTSGTVELHTDVDQLWVISTAVSKNTGFTPYPGWGGEKLSLARIYWPVGLEGFRAKLFDPGTAAGWQIVLKNSLGNIIDYGIRPAFANGKLRGMLYDAGSDTWSGSDYLESRTKSGSEYWDQTFRALGDGTVRIDVEYLDASSGETSSFSWTSPSAFGDIEEVYLCASTSAQVYNTKFKFTEFEVIPEPSGLLALVAGLPIMGFAVRRRKG